MNFIKYSHKFVKLISNAYEHGYLENNENIMKEC